ncbi:MAG: hypothetical protein AB7S26_26200 [Sandaracinaceae bacterium]
MIDRHGLAGRAVIVALLLCASACGPNIVNMPTIGWTLPPNVSSERYVAAVTERSEATGYQVLISQPHRGRVGLRAIYTDRWVRAYGVYRIALACQRNGQCSLVPIGPRVEPLRNSHLYRLPEAFRDEMLHLARVLQPAPLGVR